jgi:hypothetical protein
MSTMEVKSRNNEYRGVNAHLNSELQGNTSEWETFHHMHISELVRTINKLLPSNYVVVPERALQIRTFHPSSGEEIIPGKSGRKKIEKPDAAIYRSQGSKDFALADEPISTPTLRLPAKDTIDDPESLLTAISIRLVKHRQFGDPITWIELLSTTNKPYHSGYDQYREKRRHALLGGAVFVEIDYLHESLPVIRGLTPYPDEEAFPYYIAVTTPRPTFDEGITDVYGFGVDEALPTVPIPLADDNFISLDFNKVYNDAFDSTSYYSQLVDYSQEPPRMNSYRADDQERIRARMAAVQEAQKQV